MTKPRIVQKLILMALFISARAYAQGMNIPCDPNDSAATSKCLSALEQAFPGIADGPDCWGNHTCSAPNSNSPTGWYCNYQIQNRCYGSNNCCDPVNSTCTPGNSLGCGQGCNSPYLNCHSNNDYSFGCDTNGSNDPNHCGACDKVCPAPANATPGCSNSQCGIGTCNTGFGDCDKNAANGCEANFNTDVNHCGACGTACTDTAGVTGTSCNSGACAITTCSTGYGDCDGVYSNGCETWTNGDVNNCGACGNRCTHYASESATCSGGVCGTACLSGTADCDGNPLNGCETKTSNDINNCGACHHVCPGGSASQRPTCTSGVCGLTSCAAGYDTCSTGGNCGTHVAVDPNNCGGCGVSCSGENLTRDCAAGVCDGTCNAGFADCNGDKLHDGCEVNTQTDVNNCGACSRACAPAHAIALCSAGSCGYSQCAQGWSDCDGNLANGCETPGACSQPPPPDLAMPADLAAPHVVDAAMPAPVVDAAAPTGDDASASPPPRPADMSQAKAASSSGCALGGAVHPAGRDALALLVLAVVLASLRRRRAPDLRG